MKKGLLIGTVLFLISCGVKSEKKLLLPDTSITKETPSVLKRDSLVEKYSEEGTLNYIEVYRDGKKKFGFYFDKKEELNCECIYLGGRDTIETIIDDSTSSKVIMERANCTYYEDSQLKRIKTYVAEKRLYMEISFLNGQMKDVRYKKVISGN